MKKYFFTFLLPVAMMLGLIATSQSIFAQKMTITTMASEVEFELAGKGEVTIDWGDGTASDKDTLGDDRTYYTHSYSSSSNRTIVITGKNVTKLICYMNQLITSLDVSKNKLIEELGCCSNELVSLDVSNNQKLKELYCYGNKLTSLDVSNNNVLEELQCSDNKLTNLDVSKNKDLKKLYCSYNQFTSLDVSKNNVLEVLYCSNNKLTSLDLSKNNVLEELYCFSNQLISLDINKKNVLKKLFCFSNQLTSLNMGTNNVLEELLCQENKLTSTALNALFVTLHSNIIKRGKDICIFNNPGENDCNISVAESKRWKVISEEELECGDREEDKQKK